MSVAVIMGGLTTLVGVSFEILIQSLPEHMLPFYHIPSLLYDIFIILAYIENSFGIIEIAADPRGAVRGHLYSDPTEAKATRQSGAAHPIDSKAKKRLCSHLQHYEVRKPVKTRHGRATVFGSLYAS